MQTNPVLKQIALALGAIASLTLLLSASSSPSIDGGRVVLAMVIVAFFVLNLLALTLSPGLLRDGLLYVAVALQMVASLGLTVALLLIGTGTVVLSTAFNGIVADLLAEGSLWFGLSALTLVILIVQAVGLWLTISRRDTEVLRGALGTSIVGIQLIVPGIVAVTLFVLGQVFTSAQDDTVRAWTALVGAAAMVAAGIAVLAALARRMYLTENRGVVVGISVVLSALGILAGALQSGLLLYIGIVAAVLAWLLILVVRTSQRSLGWVGLLIVLGAAGVIPFFTPAAGNVALMVIPLAFGATASAASNSTVISRSTAAILGVVTLVLIFDAGTISNAAGGIVDPNVANIALALFLIAAVFGAASWLVAITGSASIGAWGWLINTVLLLNVGALLFGLFGPTPEDIRQTRRQKAARRSAGLA